jgi:hypothetical protein
MSDLTAYERAFLSAVAGVHASWIGAGREALEDPQVPVWVDKPAAVEVLRNALASAEEREAFRSLLTQVIAGVLHSTLVCIDGGSNAPGIDGLSLVGPDGVAFRKYVHEYLYEFISPPGDDS